MNILIDIGHPAHVHLFRNFHHEMTMRGHDLHVTVKNLPSARELLDLYGIPYEVTGDKGGSITGKALKQASFSLRLARIAWKRRIDFGIGSSLSIAHASRLTGMKSIVFDDDDDSVQPLMVRYGHPFADAVVSPSSLIGARASAKALFYPGYHELAYLHPKRFVPDKGVLKEAGVDEGDRYFVMRFNAFRAHHDKGVRGLSAEQKLSLVQQLERHGRVFITTESAIEKELSGYRLRVRPDKIHSLLSQATMFIGDSQTMTSEAAVLGVPALRCNTLSRSISYLREEEDKYALTYGFSPEDFSSLQGMIDSLLKKPDLAREWRRKRDIMLGDMIDVTSFMIWLVENYPPSGRVSDMKDIDFSMFR